MAPRYRVTLTVEERAELKALTRAATKTTGKRFQYARGAVVMRPRAGRAGMGRGPGGRGAGRLGPHHRAPETAVRGAGVEVGLGAQTAGAAAAGAHLRRRVGGSLDRLGLLLGPDGAEALDAASAGKESGGIGLGRAGVGDDGAADAKKNKLQPHRKKYWRIPPRANAAFVACMEDVLDVYARPYDPRQPVVCMDETNKQLVGEVREPLPVEPGQPERIEHEYVRNGVAQVFLEVEPLTGRSHVEATERRTRQDWARWIEGMLERRYPEAERVVLVMDNLNTHGIESLYATFEPRHARELARRLEIHYTPKHGKLAQHCGNRTERAVRAMPRPPDSKLGSDATGDRGLGRRSESTANRDRLAIQDGGCPDQAEKPLPAALSVKGY